MVSLLVVTITSVGMMYGGWFLWPFMYPMCKAKGRGSLSLTVNWDTPLLRKQGRKDRIGIQP